MLGTYALTVRLLAEQQQNLGPAGWASGWLGGPAAQPLGNYSYVLTYTVYVIATWKS